VAKITDQQVQKYIHCFRKLFGTLTKLWVKKYTPQTIRTSAETLAQECKKLALLVVDPDTEQMTIEQIIDRVEAYTERIQTCEQNDEGMKLGLHISVSTPTKILLSEWEEWKLRQIVDQIVSMWGTP
jgi:hypothetical protein